MWLLRWKALLGGGILLVKINMPFVGQFARLGAEKQSRQIVNPGNAKYFYSSY